MRVYESVAAAWSELHERLGGLPSVDAAPDVWAELRYREVHHSTALDGNSLAERDVRNLLDHGLATGARPLTDYLQVRGYADAVDSRPASPTVEQLHRTLMDPQWTESTLRPGGLVAVRLAQWVAEANTLEPDPARLPDRLAWLHSEFVRLAPFTAGNRLTARLLTNQLLVRLGMLPLVVFKPQSTAYAEALARSDHSGLADLFATALEASIRAFVGPAIAEPVRPVPLMDLVSADFSLAALRQAARRGRLDAIRGPDGVWRSSRAAVDNYRRSRYHATEVSRSRA